MSRLLLILALCSACLCAHSRSSPWVCATSILRYDPSRLARPPYTAETSQGVFDYFAPSITMPVTVCCASTFASPHLIVAGYTNGQLAVCDYRIDTGKLLDGTKSYCPAMAIAGDPANAVDVNTPLAN